MCEGFSEDGITHLLFHSFENLRSAGMSIWLEANLTKGAAELANAIQLNNIRKPYIYNMLKSIMLDDISQIILKTLLGPKVS